ncbi:MAG: type II toxin-antitoxin system VapC family toxin [Candidatus Njordarchaeia archaeon]
MILDTTYFLPLVGIEVDRDLLKAVDKGTVGLSYLDIGLSSITIFEVQAKAAKSGLDSEDIYRGINAILKTFDVIPFYIKNIVKVASELRERFNDYIDCIIMATAINYGGELATEDEDILSEKIFLKRRYGLKVYSYKDLMKH